MDSYGQRRSHIKVIDLVPSMVNECPVPLATRHALPLGA